MCFIVVGNKRKQVDIRNDGMNYRTKGRRKNNEGRLVVSIWFIKEGRYHGSLNKNSGR